MTDFCGVSAPIGGSMIRKILLVGCVFLCLGLPRTAAQGTAYEFDKNADFPNYKTYKWVTLPGTEQLDELTSGQLTGTLEVELEKKGLKKSHSGQADLEIGYEVTKGNAKQLKNYDIGAAYGSVGGANATAGVNSTTIHSGQLILVFYDTTKNQLVWRGIVIDPIEADAKPDKKQKHMTKAVEKLLKNYPPQKKS
jgi:Domain of unknown function (DUF4136)